MYSDVKKIIGMIPCRMESSRLPGKPLIDICGLPMIAHVLKRCHMSKLLDDVYVATDSDEISDVVKSFNGKVIMTSPSHKNGTERIAEASESIDADIIVNIQGDEALVKPEHIDTAINCLIQNYSKAQVAILINKFNKKNSKSDIKVVVNQQNEVMYFSREDIPSSSRANHDGMFKAYHVVPFKKSFLIEFSNWNETPLEKIEYIEFMRILEKGHNIVTEVVDSSALSVDTKEDLDFVINKMRFDKIFQQYKVI